MQKTEIIRAYLLEPGDQFIMLGAEYHVIKKDAKGIHFAKKYLCASGYTNRTSRLHTFGLKDQQRIELIINNQNRINYEHSNQFNYFSRPGIDGPVAITYRENVGAGKENESRKGA